MTETIKTTAERPLRRRDRQLTEDEALQIVRHAPHAVLSTADAAGVPYGVPVNAVYAEGNVYWHGTFMKSRKGDNIDANPKVSLCFVAYEAVDVRLIGELRQCRFRRYRKPHHRCPGA